MYIACYLRYIVLYDVEWLIFVHLDLTYFAHGVINSCVGFKPHKHVGCKGVSIGEVRDVFWASPKSHLSQKILKYSNDTLVCSGRGCGSGMVRIFYILYFSSHLFADVGLIETFQSMLCGS